jgi:ribosomal protein S18 acetylase RimI-like enzyme
MKLRLAVGEDAAAVAYVQKTTWQHAYKGIVPQAYLDSMDAPEQMTRRTQNWQTGLVNPANVAFVAEDDTGTVKGFVIGGACRPENGDLCAKYAGELYAIYLLPDFHGQGIGRKLVEALGAKLVQAGYTGMLLWVLKDNQPSRGFYERMGGQPVTEKSFELAGTTLLEVAYGWQDLSIFQAES